MKKTLVICAALTGLSCSTNAMEHNKIPSLEHLCVAACAKNADRLTRIDGLLVRKDGNNIPTDLETAVMRGVTITPANSDMMRAWSQRLTQKFAQQNSYENADFTREQLQQVAAILCLNQQGKALNQIGLKNFVLNFSDEQQGKIRFKLLTWFMCNKQSRLSADHQIYLGWNFLFGQTSQARKDAITNTLVTKFKDIDPYTNIIFDSFEAKKGTAEYRKLCNQIADYASTTQTAFVAMNRLPSSIEESVLRIQADKIFKNLTPNGAGFLEQQRYAELIGQLEKYVRLR